MSVEKEIIPPPYDPSSSTQKYPIDAKKGFDELAKAELEVFEPIEINGKVVDWDFVNYNEQMGYEITTYVSQDARAKYKASKEVRTKEVIDLQRSGYAIPLLKTDHSWKALYSHSLMKILRFLPPPADQNRLFDPKKDRYEFCMIRKWICSSYNRFEFNFSPNPTNKAEDFTLYMIYHRRYPIADVSPYNGKRYRFITPKLWSLKMDWSYELHELSEEQDSLTDNLHKDGKVPKNNPLLGSAWKNNLLPQVKDTDLFKGRELGVAVYREKLYKVAPVRFGYQETVPGDVGQQRDSESINSVSDEALVILCLVSVLKNVEDNRSLGLDF